MSSLRSMMEKKLQAASEAQVEPRDEGVAEPKGENGTAETAARETPKKKRSER